MKSYYVSKTPFVSGDTHVHEVHTSMCAYLPDRNNRYYLGEFTSCRGAVAMAKEQYQNSSGCFYCARECYRSQR